MVPFLHSWGRRGDKAGGSGLFTKNRRAPQIQCTLGGGWINGASWSRYRTCEGLYQRHVGAPMKINLIGGVTPLYLLLTSVFASAQLPLSFEPNQGQTDARVQFVSRGSGYTIFLSPASATFALRRNVVRMDLLGGNAKTVMQPQDRLPGVANYLMGSTRRERAANIPTYAKARAHAVYPGIDVVYYGTQDQLEYDFVLAPGAELRS